MFYLLLSSLLCGNIKILMRKKCAFFSANVQISQDKEVVDKPLHDCLTLHCTCTPGITKVAPPARPVTIMAEVLTVPGESLIVVK